MWPSADLRRLILFCCRCWMVDLWKKDVFLSPSLSHNFLDFCFHRVSSCCSLCMSSWSRVCSIWVSSSEYPLLMALICISWIYCSRCFFSRNMLPNYSLFHFLTHSFMCLSLWWKTNMHESSITGQLSHHSFMRRQKSWWRSQNFTNRKGWLKNSPRYPHSRHMGQWSKPTVGSTMASISPLPTMVDSKTNKQSSLDAMCLFPECLFCQVNNPLVVLISTRCISSINLLKEVDAALIDLTPPPFFPPKIVWD